MPAKKWFKYFETKGLKYFVFEGNPTEEQKQQSFETLYDQYIEKFGVNEEYLKFFNHQKKILQLRIQYALEKQPHIEMHLKIAVKKYQESNPTQGDAQSYLEVVAMIEKALNRNIDENNVSVEKFYTYLKQLKNEQ